MTRCRKAAETGRSRLNDSVGPNSRTPHCIPPLVIFPDYDESNAGVEVRPVGRARAAFVLGEQSSALWAIEPRPLAAVARLVNAAPAYQVSYSNAFEAAPVIANELLPNATPVSTEPVSDEKQPIPTQTDRSAAC